MNNQMPRQIKPLLLIPDHLPQLQNRRCVLRLHTDILVEISVQTQYNLLALSHPPTDGLQTWSTESQWVMSLMTLGTVLLLTLSRCQDVTET